MEASTGLGPKGAWSFSKGLGFRAVALRVLGVWGFEVQGLWPRG